jgi:tRNA (adenine37-N6)-methyltransferase
MSEITFKPLGFIESCFKEKFGTPRQPNLVPESKARLKIRGDLNPVEALKGLEEFSHVWLIFYFHKNSNKEFNAKIYPPRMGGDKIGVFATRSPHRYNPIGISNAKLDRIEGDTLFLSGIDLIEGTPVLDIKPYLPSFDSIPAASLGWTCGTDTRKLDVEFTPEADLQIDNTEKEIRLREMITRILSNDPRNPMDKEESRQNKTLGFFLDDFNVVFSVEGHKAKVLKVETREEFDKRHI